MGYKTLVSMNIAIIGTSKLSALLAQKLVNAGHEVFIGVKEDVMDEQIIHLPEEHESIQIGTIEYAAYVADIIIITTPSSSVRETAYLLDDVRKKVILDFSNDDTNEGINTANAIKAITGAQHVIRCIHTTDYKPMLAPLFEEQVDILMAGDSKKSKEMTKILAKDMEYTVCKDFGSGDTVPLLDEMARAWQALCTKYDATVKTPLKVVKNK